MKIETEEIFPEKWSMKGDRKLSDDRIFLEWNNGEWWGDSDDKYYNFSGELVSRSMKPEYQVITFEQWKSHYFPENPSGAKAGDGRKLLGYKAPMDLYEGDIKVGTILGPSHVEMDNRWLIAGSKKTIIYIVPKEIVETWEPVYEEVNTSKQITVGSESDQVEIFKDGNIIISGRGKTTIDVVKKIYEKALEVVGVANVAGFSVAIDVDVPFIRIGCVTENHLFSAEDLHEIIATHVDLNK